MQKGNIRSLSKSAARLLVVLLLCDGSERVSDLPRLMEQAGLTPGQYRLAYRQLTDLGFIVYSNGSICLLLEENQDNTRTLN